VVSVAPWTKIFTNISPNFLGQIYEKFYITVNTYLRLFQHAPTSYDQPALNPCSTVWLALGFLQITDLLKLKIHFKQGNCSGYVKCFSASPSWLMLKMKSWMFLPSSWAREIHNTSDPGKPTAKILLTKFTQIFAVYLQCIRLQVCQFQQQSKSV
jgi:hypothetical protein